MSVTLNASQLHQLLDLLESTEETEINVEAFEGARGPGVYAYFGDYIDEDSCVFIDPEAE